MFGLGTLARVARELRQDLTAAQDRDPAARGVLFGLNHDSDAAAIGQAVLEGVAFAFADGLDALIEAGATIDKISVIGGGARSMWWGGVLAAALKRPLVYRDGSEVGPAFGAARLARIAKTAERAEDVCRPPPVRATVEPNARAMIEDDHLLSPGRKSGFHTPGLPVP